MTKPLRKLTDMCNIMKTAIRLFTFSIIILLSSCDKEDVALKGTGILKNMTGFDGCGWVIQFDKNGTKEILEPNNLDEFKMILTDGQKVDFSYYKTTSPSICMVGEVIKLASLTNK